MTIVLQIYPNGEFTHGVDASHRRDRNRPRKALTPHELIPVGDSVSLRSGDTTAEIREKHICVEPGDTFRNEKQECTYTYLCADMGKHIYAIEFDCGIVAVDTLYDSLARLINKGDVVPLGLSAARNLKKIAETRRTPAKMTKRMARRIRNAGHILQEEFGKDSLSFLTLTLPNLCEDDLCKVVANWGAMVHKFLVWLRYRLDKIGIELRYVCATEIQTKRLELRNEYAPHLHLLFRGRYGKKSAWGITPIQARKEWTRCIKSVCGHSNFDKSALENLQRVRHNAAGYISKYLSKGACSLPDEHGTTSMAQLSTDWGSMDRITSKAITSNTIVMRGDAPGGRIVWVLIRAIPLLVETRHIAFYKAGYIELAGSSSNSTSRGLHVGVGRFSIPIDEDSISFLVQFAMNNCKEDLTDFWSTSYAAKKYGNIADGRL